MSMMNIYQWRTTLIIVFVVFMVIYGLFHFSANREVPIYGLKIQPTEQPITSEPKQKTETHGIIMQPIEEPITPETKQKSAVSSQAVCNATFGRTLEENIAKIKSYRLSRADKYFKDLDSPTPRHNKTLKQSGSATDELPVIVTAASSNHYLESVEMLTSLATVIRPTYPTIPVYYYDLGLEPAQKIEVKKICNCTVLDFPFDKFPGHVQRLKAYCWKPLIIKLTLQISQFVMWMDASIQFKTSKLYDLFIQAKQYGVLMYHNQFSLPAHVHRDTFTFLEESPCLFKDFTEYHAGLILIHSGNSVVKN